MDYRVSFSRRLVLVYTHIYIHTRNRIEMKKSKDKVLPPSSHLKPLTHPPIHLFTAASQAALEHTPSEAIVDDPRQRHLFELFLPHLARQEG